MKTNRRTLKAANRFLKCALASVALMVGLLPGVANAAINSVSVSLSDPTPSATSDIFTWTWSGYQTASSVKCIKILFSQAADGTGGVPTGLSAAAATLTGSYGGTWTRDSTNSASNPVFNWTTGVTPSAGPQTLILGAMTSSSVAGTYFETLTTYDTAGSGSSGNCGGATRDAATVSAFEITTGQATSVTVDPSLGLVVNTVATTTVCNGATANVSTTANTVNLGHLSSSASHAIGAESLVATTNAAHGYTVYISYSAAMTGTVTGHTYVDSTGTNGTPITWPATTEALGYTTSSTSLSGTAARFSSNLWAGLSTTGNEVMHNSSTPSAAGDTNCIAFEASAAGNTPADVYTTTVRYNAVGVF